MPEQELAALALDIEAHGQREPGVMFEGMVLDGWHRWTAANELGMQCPTVELVDTDPQDFVIAQNKARRHIQQGQLALAVASVYQWRPSAGRPKNNSAPGAGLSKTTAQLADIAGVGSRTMEQAKAVESKATPKVKEAVKSGVISVKRGAEIAKLPAKEQAKALEAPKPPPGHEREDELAEAHHTITDLADENESLRTRLAVGVMDGTEEEKQEAAQTIADLRAHVKTLEAENIALKSSRDHYQREASELRKQIKMNERELKKARAVA